MKKYKGKSIPAQLTLGEIKALLKRETCHVICKDCFKICCSECIFHIGWGTKTKKILKEYINTKQFLADQI